MIITQYNITHDISMQDRIFAQNRDALGKISLRMLTGAIWTNQMGIVSHVAQNVMTTTIAEPLNVAPRTVVGGRRELVMI